MMIMMMMMMMMMMKMKMVVVVVMMIIIMNLSDQCVVTNIETKLLFSKKHGTPQKDLYDLTIGHSWIPSAQWILQKF